MQLVCPLAPECDAQVPPAEQTPCLMEHRVGEQLTLVLQDLCHLRVPSLEDVEDCRGKIGKLLASVQDLLRDGGCALALLLVVCR